MTDIDITDNEPGSACEKALYNEPGATKPKHRNEAHTCVLLILTDRPVTDPWLKTIAQHYKNKAEHTEFLLFYSLRNLTGSVEAQAYGILEEVDEAQSIIQQVRQKLQTMGFDKIRCLPVTMPISDNPLQQVLDCEKIHEVIAAKGSRSVQQFLKRYHIPVREI